MTAEERQEFEAYKLAKEKKAAEAKRKSDREAYTALVDETIAAVMPELTKISEAIAQKKTAAAEAFRGALEMKAELFGVKDDQQSHTFTNSEGTMRITIGHYMLDNYRDTVNEGIAMVKTYIESMKAELFGVKDDQQSHTFTNSEGTMRITIGHYMLDNYRDTVNEGIAMVKTYIESQARDDASRALVKAILRLLSRDEAGNLKASRVLQLQKMAEETGDERFIEGVRIIQESYQPTPSKDYIRAAVRDESGAWVAIPLSMTDV